MPARASWKGFLRVGHLSVPIKAFSASSSDPAIALHQLHRGCGRRIQQQKVCPVHGVLSSDAIAMGYEYAKDQHLELDNAELAALNAVDDKAVHVHAFITPEQIDVVYHSGRTYYITPDGPPGQRPFGVLRAGMDSTATHAMAEIVLSGKRQWVVLRPLGRLIAMTILEYPDYVRPALAYESEVEASSISEAEQTLVAELIAAMSQPRLDFASYHDEHARLLNALIEQKVALLPAEEPGRLEEASEQALVAALRASLSAAKSNPAVRDAAHGSDRRDSLEKSA